VDRLRQKVPRYSLNEVQTLLRLLFTVRKREKARALSLHRANILLQCDKGESALVKI